MAEVEAEVRRIPSVTDCFVRMTKYKRQTDAIVAYVTPSKLTETSLTAALAHMDDYLRPVVFVSVRYANDIRIHIYTRARTRTRTRTNMHT